MTHQQFIEKRQSIWNQHLPDKDEWREVANLCHEYIAELEESLEILHDENHHLANIVDQYKKLYR